MRKIKRYGWHPDLPDHRDRLFRPAVLDSLPPAVDLRPLCPAVYDQGELGSCTANAIAGAIEFDLLKQNQDFRPSRLFIYYNERVIEGTIDSDSGAQLRDGIKTVAQYGDCHEELWPYDIVKFAVKPLPVCYDEAIKYQALSYESLDQDMESMETCLASGYPFVFGFSVYDSFESPDMAKTGVLGMPGEDETLLGGHAVMAVGYDQSTETFLVRNSWGPNWGQAGYFTIPYEYLNDSTLSSDFWTIRAVK
jgi:C1A family cysteine protease